MNRKKHNHFVNVIKSRIGDKVPITEPLFKDNVAVECSIKPVEYIEAYQVDLEARFFATLTVKKDVLIQAREDADIYINHTKQRLADLMVRELYGDVQKDIIELLIEMNKRYVDKDIQRKLEDILESIS